MVLSPNMATSSSLFFMQTIVADMRKVLAKNPQVEQQRLHRRVFLEGVNPENQALMVREAFVLAIYVNLFNYSASFEQ